MSDIAKQILKAMEDRNCQTEEESEAAIDSVIAPLLQESETWRTVMSFCQYCGRAHFHVRTAFPKKDPSECPHLRQTFPSTLANQCLDCGAAIHSAGAA